MKEGVALVHCACLCPHLYHTLPISRPSKVGQLLDASDKYRLHVDTRMSTAFDLRVPRRAQLRQLCTFSELDACCFVVERGEYSRVGRQVMRWWDERQVGGVAILSRFGVSLCVRNVRCTNMYT